MGGLPLSCDLLAYRAYVSSIDKLGGRPAAQGGESMPTAQHDTADAIPIVVMGVAGSGKSSVGAELAKRLGLPFCDADEFHPQANIDKMSAGIPLTDEDRWPWLDAIGKALGEADGRLIVACSALRRIYRDRLTRTAGRPVIFVWLDGSQKTIAARMNARRHHFMPPSLLDSQFATLEPPAEDELAVRVSIEPPVDEAVEAAFAALPAAFRRAISLSGR
jgi:gluconokinase